MQNKFYYIFFYTFNGRHKTQRIHNKMLWNQAMFAVINNFKKEFFDPEGIFYQFLATLIHYYF
jgi:hypothetical protein